MVKIRKIAIKNDCIVANISSEFSEFSPQELYDIPSGKLYCSAKSMS
jgi:hypothetical protein